MHASNASIVRPPIEAIDWDALAWLMSIPKEARDHFVWWLQTLIEGAWQGAAKPPGKRAGWRRREIDAEIARTGRAFKRAIEQRSFLSTPSDRTMIEMVEAHLQHMEAPRGHKRADRLALFLENLFIFTDGIGGRIVFNRKARRGNVVDLLDELRPFMPPGFIPNVLPVASIERLCTRARGVLLDLGSDPRAVYRLSVGIIEAVRKEREKGDQEDWALCDACASAADSS